MSVCGKFRTFGSSLQICQNNNSTEGFFINIPLCLVCAREKKRNIEWEFELDRQNRLALAPPPSQADEFNAGGISISGAK